MGPWPVWLALLVVGGWVLVAVAVGVVIGWVVKARDRRRLVEPPVAAGRPPRGNVDLTTAVRAIDPDRHHR